MGTRAVDPTRQELNFADREHPNYGAIAVRVDGELITLTRAIHWVEDGLHYVASSEFQVAASGESFREAFFAARDALLYEARCLSELIESGDAAPNEVRDAAELGQRIAMILEAEESAVQRREAARRRLARSLKRQAKGEKKWQFLPGVSPISGVLSPA